MAKIVSKPPYDPVGDWRKLEGKPRINLRNESEFYSGSAGIRLVRSEFGMWALHILPLSGAYEALITEPRQYGLVPSKLGVYVLVGSSIIDELKKIGVPVYLEEKK